MKRLLKSELMVLAVVLVLLLLGACGESNDPTDGNVDGDEDRVSDGDLTDGDEAGCGSLETLAGTWTGADITLEIGADGSYHAVGVNNVGYDVEGTFTLEDCLFSLSEISGDLACPAEQVGSYTLSATDATLTFTLVSDDCPGRVMGLNGKTFTRQ